MATELKLQVKHEAKIKEMEINKSGDVGQFFAHVNKRLSYKTGIAPLKDTSGNLVVNDADKAMLLNNYFVGVCTTDNDIIPGFIDYSTHNTDTTLDSVHFDFNLVRRCIKRLKSKFSSGPDGLPALLFKNLIGQISEPLAQLFNCIMKFGNLPSEWKKAIVRPIFKKGAPSDPGNYRPISLTCIACKLFESGIKTYLIPHLYEHNLISGSQHGFLSKHSTCTNLLEALNDWTRNLDLRADTLVAYIDFCKAFDSVSIPKLLYKLSLSGISGRLLSCLTSFLSNRSQCVRIGNGFSDEKPVGSGVPQGSVLGPVLFILFVNDISTSIGNNSQTKLFADDLKSYNRVSNDQDLLSFSQSLKSISVWAEAWQLPIAYQKCNFMKISNSNSNQLPVFTLGPHVLHEITETKDLGIFFDNNLSFATHINSVAANAKKRMFLIHKSFTSRDPSSLLLAYKTYVLPILDYCSPVWSPYHLADIKKLESVQRLFTKRLNGYRGLTYAERLNKASLCSLECRRLKSDLVLCYKLLHDLTTISDISKFFVRVSTSNTRGHSWRLRADKPRLETRLHFYAYRTAKVWNKLSSLTVEANSVAVFKGHLEKENLSKFLKLKVV